MPAACRVSVIIVNYKAYEELEACLESLARAVESRRDEVIVVDNDSSPYRLWPLAGRFSWARFLPRPDNPGFARAVNAGTHLARGEHFLFLNPDTIVMHTAVDTLAAYLDAHPRVAVVGARVLDSDGRVQRSARRFPTMATGLFGRTSLLTRLWPHNALSRRDLVADESTAEPLQVDWVAGSCMLVRAEAFRDVSGFDERFFLYWEDADLCKRLRAAGWSTFYLPSASVVHRVGGSSRHASARSIRAFHESAYLYYRKHVKGLLGYVGVPIAGFLLYSRMTLKLILHRLGDGQDGPLRKRVG